MIVKKKVKNLQKCIEYPRILELLDQHIMSRNKPKRKIRKSAILSMGITTKFWTQDLFLFLFEREKNKRYIVENTF